MNDVWMVLHKFGTDGKIQDGHPSSSNFSIGFSYNNLKLFISETSERLKLKQNECFCHHLIPRLCFWCQSEIQDGALDCGNMLLLKKKKKIQAPVYSKLKRCFKSIYKVLTFCSFSLTELLYEHLIITYPIPTIFSHCPDIPDDKFP
jgi:hypothetical protein